MTDPILEVDTGVLQDIYLFIHSFLHLFSDFLDREKGARSLTQYFEYLKARPGNLQTHFPAHKFRIWKIKFTEHTLFACLFINLFVWLFLLPILYFTDRNICVCQSPFLTYNVKNNFSTLFSVCLCRAYQRLEFLQEGI